MCLVVLFFFFTNVPIYTHIHIVLYSSLLLLFFFFLTNLMFTHTSCDLMTSCVCYSIRPGCLLNIIS